MPNVLDVEPLRALVERAKLKIKDGAVAARFGKLAFAKLLSDPNNFRPATHDELSDAPEWAAKALARGEKISAFRPNRSVSMRIHAVARRLADTCRVATTDPASRPNAAVLIAAAQLFLRKIERSSFDAAARKALYFSRAYQEWICSADREALCPAQQIAATQGRMWRRITSFAELRAVGREFTNCLARTSNASMYARALRTGAGQFWVLRDAADAGLIVALAPAPMTDHFLEVRGPNNARIPADDADLVRLGASLGMTEAAPPEPPPIAPAPAQTALERLIHLNSLADLFRPTILRSRRYAA